MEELIGRLGLSAPGQALILLGATAAFLAAPDVDLMLVRLLHHRSILTHSVLLPLLVLWFLPGLGPAAVAGAALGVAVHLSADLLSPSRGYGAVWLPEPFQVSLGGWSRLWLAVNALGAAWLAVEVLPAGEGWRNLLVGVGATAAIGYGIVNEGSMLAVLVALLFLGGGLGLHQWLQAG